jgi:hypothetical protein
VRLYLQEGFSRSFHRSVCISSRACRIALNRTLKNA